MAEPVYPQIRDKIESAIQNGEWSDRLPSASILAKRFNTSHLTVLKAIKLLKDDGKIIVKERQGTYVAKGAASRPFSPYVCVIGMSQDADTPRHHLEYYYHQSLKNYIESHGLKMLSIQHFDKLDSYFADMLINMRTGGYLFTNSYLTKDVADRMKLKGVPFVALNRIEQVEGISYADFEHEHSLRRLLNHFIAAGHKRIGLAHRQAPFLLTYSKWRFNAYRDALESAGIYHPELVHVFDNDLIFQPNDEAYEQVAEQMFKQFYCREKPPTALHVCSLQVARAFLKRIRKDAPEWAETLALSTMVHAASDYESAREDFCCIQCADYSELARIGVETLVQRMADPEAAAVKQTVPITLRIVRKVLPVETTAIHT